MRWMRQKESVKIQAHDDTSTSLYLEIRSYVFSLSGDMFNVVPLGNQVSDLFPF